MENFKNDNIIIAQILSGEIDEQTKAKMKEQFKEHDEGGEELDELGLIWNTSEKLNAVNNIDVDADWQNVRKRMAFERHSRKIPFGKYFLRIAGIMVLAFGLAYFLKLMVGISGNQSEKTEFYNILADNARRIVELPDGTVITLNQHASIIYNNGFTQANRDVILEGEAYFNVARNEDLPFRVFVSDNTVEVLGTSFNVMSTSDEVQVSVTSGKVAFYETVNKGNRVELMKNEQVEYKSLGKTFNSIQSVDTSELSWNFEMLNFYDTPLDKVLLDVATFYNKKLVTNVTHSHLVSGDLNNLKLEEVIQFISQTLPAEVEIVVEDETITVN